MKNAFALLLLAQGTPMLLAGDEMRRSQRGNNNAWCQDNEISWLDWSLLERHADLHRFVRGMIHFRRRHPNLARREYLLDAGAPEHKDPPGYTRVQWSGVDVGKPDWSHWSRTLAYTLRGDDDQSLHIVINAHTGPLDFALPPNAPGCHWYRALDTALPSGEDFAEFDRELRWSETRYPVAARSVVVFLER